MDSDWVQIISILISAILTFLITWLKGRDERKRIEASNDKKLAAQVSLIVNELKSISSSVVNLELDLKSHMEETNFVRDLRDSIRNRSKQILYLSLMLDQKYKNILGYWADIIEKFGVDYYENKNRKKDPATLEKQLTQDMRRDLEDFNNYIDDIINEYKLVKGKKYRFSVFLENYQVHNKTHLLVSRLVENGFTNTDKIIEVFVKYIDDYFSTFLTAAAVWNELEEYNYEKENAA